jgi:flagellar biosynthetic protein FliR
MELGVHRWLLRAIALSFRFIPIGSFGVTMAHASGVLRMSKLLWLIGAEIAFPVLMLTMLIDFAVGLVSRASPQLPGVFIGISAKTLLGLLMLYAVVAYWPATLERHFIHALGSLEALLGFSA